MIGVIQLHVHKKILHNYDNEVTYDVYKMYNIWYGIILSAVLTQEYDGQLPH